MTRSAPVAAVRGSRCARNLTPPTSGPWSVCQPALEVKQVAIGAVGTVGLPIRSAEPWNRRGSSAISDWLSGARSTDSGR